MQGMMGAPTWSVYILAYLSENQYIVQAAPDIVLKNISSPDTSAFSALRVLEITVLYEFTYLLTYFMYNTNYQ